MCMSYDYSHTSKNHTMINGLLHPFIMVSVPFVLVHYWKEVLRTGYHALHGKYVESDARFNQGSDWMMFPEPPGSFDPLGNLLDECISGNDAPDGLKGTRHGCFLASLGLLICGIVFLLSKNGICSSFSFDSLYHGLFFASVLIGIQFLYKITMVFLDGDHPNKDKIGDAITLFGIGCCGNYLKQPVQYLFERPFLIAGFIFLSGIVLMIYSKFFSASYNSIHINPDTSNYKFLKQTGALLLSASLGTLMLLS